MSADPVTTEEALAEIWRNALRRADIDLDGNFFELGGSSLAASALIVGIEERFGLSLPLHVVLDRPTIASLSEYIDGILWVRREGETEGDL